MSTACHYFAALAGGLNWIKRAARFSSRAARNWHRGYRYGTRPRIRGRNWLRARRVLSDLWRREMDFEARQIGNTATDVRAVVSENGLPAMFLFLWNMTQTSAPEQDANKHTESQSLSLCLCTYVCACVSVFTEYIYLGWTNYRTVCWLGAQWYVQ